MFILTVVGADGERDGCLIGFATQCSIKPQRFITCISKENRTFDAVRFPFEHVAVRRARLDEAVVIPAVSALLTTAEARHVAEHFGVFCREMEISRDDFRRPRRCVGRKRNRRVVVLFVRTRCSRSGDRFSGRFAGFRALRLRGRRVGFRGGRFDRAVAAHEGKNADPDDGDDDRREEQWIQSRF